MLSSTIKLFWVVFIFLSFNSISPSSSSTNVTLFNDAQFINNSIFLTQELNCLSLSSPPSLSPSSPSSGIGRSFYINPVRFLDSSTNNTSASFSCQFSFTIISSPLCSSGDGIAFLITSNINSFSAYMGLPNQPINDQDWFIAVEFDTHFDPSVGDINDNHIAIDINTVMSFASIDVSSKGIDLKSGKQITAWIEYRDSEKLVRVWVDYSQIRPKSPILVSQIDLSKQFKQFMHVGFSASNGKGSAAHVVHQWKFKTFGLISSLLPMDTVSELDCLICSSDDSNLENDHLDNRVRELALIFGGLSAFIVSVLSVLVILCFCLVRRKKTQKRKLNETQIYRFQGNKVPKKLSLSEIKAATNGFNQNKIVGEGASAIVYEGSLPSCGSVAVKRFNPIRSSIRNPFTIELGTMVGCLRHKNLVQLQGWCCEGNELVLVYEYMPNGSLDKVLHKFKGCLSWERRLNIVIGISNALVYLHEECERQIIHRDVKSCNIMLDSEFNAKLGDFGLAEVYEHSDRSREATLPAGTMGYLAPEYVYSGVPTIKTDVYSFGVVVLEVASGRQPVDDRGTPVSDWVWDLWERGKLIEAADSKLRGKFDRTEMERMLIVGLSCVHPNYEKRPTVREAERMIRGESPLPILPTRKPIVKIQSIYPEEFVGFRGEGNGNLDATPWLTPRSHF